MSKAVKLSDVVVGELFITRRRSTYGNGSAHYNGIGVYTTIAEDLCEKISDELYVKVITHSGCEDNTKYYNTNHTTVWV